MIIKAKTQQAKGLRNQNLSFTKCIIPTGSVKKSDFDLEFNQFLKLWGLGDRRNVTSLCTSLCEKVKWTKPGQRQVKV